MSLLCVLQALLGLAVLCLIIYAIWWVVTTLLGVSIPAHMMTILKVIAVLIVLIFLVRIAVTGDFCGLFTWPLVRVR